ANIVLVGVLCRVPVRAIGPNLRRDVFGDASDDAVRIAPFCVPEVVVEALDDVREAVELRFGTTGGAAGGYWVDLSVLVGELDGTDGLLLDAVAVHIDRFEDAAGEVRLRRRRQLRYEKVEEDRELLPLGVRVRENRGEEAV